MEQKDIIDKLVSLDYELKDQERKWWRDEETWNCIGFVFLFLFVVFGIPWIYYWFTGNYMEF